MAALQNITRHAHDLSARFAKERVVLAFDEAGSLAACVRREKDGGWRSIRMSEAPKRPVPCVLLVSPEAVALRRAPSLRPNKKEAQGAVEAETERSLFRSPALGCPDVRTAALEQGHLGVMAWAPVEYLYGCFDRARELGFSPRAVATPECCLHSAEPTLFISLRGGTARLCMLHQRVPVAWQTSHENGPPLEACLKALLTELEDSGLPSPSRVLIWDGLASSGDGRDVREAKAQLACTAAQALAPQAVQRRLQGLGELLAELQLPGGGLPTEANKGVFRACLNRWEQRPLTPKQYLRLGINVACAVLSGLMLFLAAMHMDHQETNALGDAASRLKVLAARSDGATARVRDYAARIREIHKYTVDKPFVSHMFRALVDSTPKLVKLNTVRLAPDGEITLEGEAQNEVSLIAFLENLSATDVFDNAVLASMNEVGQGKQVKFVITLDYSSWKTFFAKTLQAAQ
ncbi:MAG: PilN domain-containing protein [Desulfovibrionaceae bacterium]